MTKRYSQKEELLGQVEQTSAASVADLFNANIIIGGDDFAETLHTRALLEKSGFSQLQVANNSDEVISLLRRNIRYDVCTVDLLILDQGLPGISIHDIRLMMDQFDESRLIPIIMLCKKSQWDQSRVLSELEYSITAMPYHPLIAEYLQSTVMSALAVKRDRDVNHYYQLELKDELANLMVMEARLQFSVIHDDLTGLSNRRRLEEALEFSLVQVRNFNNISVLYYIDLDRFTVLNDAEGHEAGDMLLIQVANSLRRFFRARDTLVRIGSDEFAVLVDNTSRQEAIKKAEKLRDLFDGYSFEYHGHHYQISASIGIKLIESEEAATAGTILAHANQACYTAKKRGRNRVHLYSPQDCEMRSLRHSVEWASRIRTALKEDSFVLHFQPIHCLKTAGVSHYECLLRMKGDDGSLYYPNEFIPVAEAIGLIQQIDFWVINRVFDLIRTTPSNISFAINLSAKVFLDEQLCEFVETKLQQTGIKPERVVFEITETAAISNFEQTRLVVNKLRAMGCCFALDDFGAGFNSYNYLKHFLVDILKIDGGFITNLSHDSVDQLLVKSMIDIAHSLGKLVIAEFVEDENTLKLLESYGVDYVQGYLIGRPQATFNAYPVVDFRSRVNG